MISEYIQNPNTTQFPSHWELTTLSEIMDFSNGVNAGGASYGKGVPFINLLEVVENTHLYAINIPGKVSLPDEAIANYSIKKGDVLFNRSSETQEDIALASVYMDDIPVVFGGFVIRGRMKGNRIIPSYAGYAFRANSVRAQLIGCGQGAIRANIGQVDLKKIVVPIPPLHEQRAIAEALGDVDAQLGVLDRLIAKKRDLKQAAMQQLITGKIRLPGFAYQWEIRRIGDFTDCTAGGTPSTTVPQYWGGEIRWMSSGELNKKKVYEVDGRITERGLNESSTSIIPERCVLVGLAGQGKTRGTVALNMVELCTNQSIAAIFPNEQYWPEYLYYNLDIRYEELRGMSTGDGGRGGLNLRIIKSIEVPFPTLKEQKAIADVLGEMDGEIELLVRRRAKTADIKQAMMQSLLTGKVRLA